MRGGFDTNVSKIEHKTTVFVCYFGLIIRFPHQQQARVWTSNLTSIHFRCSKRRTIKRRQVCRPLLPGKLKRGCPVAPPSPVWTTVRVGVQVQHHCTPPCPLRSFRLFPVLWQDYWYCFWRDSRIEITVFDKLNWYFLARFLASLVDNFLERFPNRNHRF